MYSTLSLASPLSRCTYLYAITLLYFLVAASTVDVFMTKWTTVVNHPQYSLEKIFAGTEPKPYAFRLLMPLIVNETFAYAPDKTLQIFSQRARLASYRYLYEQNSPPFSWSDDLIIKYGLSGTWFFVFFSATLFLLRKVAAHVSASRFLCDVSPILFALVLPLSFRADGGFIYDFPELFFLSLYLWLVLMNQRTWALFLLPLAVLNKETAVLWPLLILFPFAYVMNWEKTLRDTVLHLALAGVVFIGVHWFFRDVEGCSAEFHLVGNVTFWLDPQTYLTGLSTGFPLIPFLKPQHVIFFPLLVMMFFAYWSEKPQWLRFATGIGFAILLPLVVLFCYQDEYRNFSLLFPILFLNGVHTISSFLSKSEAAVELRTEASSGYVLVKTHDGGAGKDREKIYMPGPFGSGS